MIPAPLKESDFIKAFVLLMLCSVAGGACAGLVVGVVTSLLGHALGTSAASLRVIAGVWGGLSGALVSYLFFRFLVLRFIVRKITAAPTQGIAAGAA